LRKHCDYTFKTLCENMPKALASIQVELIWRFIEAYGEGLGAKDAVAKVQQFSSRRYTSHRRIPESLASNGSVGNTCYIRKLFHYIILP
ncbi:hypothetical protein F5879DRAFT_812866, partial [Lentinula edodes]